MIIQRVDKRESGGYFLNVSRKLIVECPEGQLEEVTRSVKEITVVRMVEVLNPDLDAEHPERVLVEIDVEILRSWGKEEAIGAESTKRRGNGLSDTVVVTECFQPHLYRKV